MLMESNQTTGAVCGTNGSVDVTGCRLSLYPMTDRYADIIINAVKQVDTRHVWAETDLFSTLYRGEQTHVIDCVRAAFVHAYQADVHMTSELTFSKGCPGDTDADSYLEEQAEPINLEARNKADFPVAVKYSFYTFGKDEYMEEIAHIVEMARIRGLNPVSAHYVTLLTGTADQIFEYFAEALAYAHKHLLHYVIEATLSVNSPSLKK